MLEEQHENFVAAVRKWDVLSATKGENERQWKKKKERGRGRGPGGPGSPLFLDQTEARRAEKKFFEFFGDRPHSSAPLF